MPGRRTTYFRDFRHMSGHARSNQLNGRVNSIHQAVTCRSEIVAVLLAGLLVAGPTFASEHRSREVTRAFQRENPCPSTGRTAGACPDFIKDHVTPLCAGGADSVSNMQWQTIEDAKAKDRWELEWCAEIRRGGRSEVAGGSGT
jgi:hypothetical protein